jgi:hypothetical protein
MSSEMKNSAFGAASAFFAEAFSDFALPPLSSMLRRRASMRLTTLAGRDGAFSLGTGNPACFERICSNRVLVAVFELVRLELAAHPARP